MTQTQPSSPQKLPKLQGNICFIVGVPAGLDWAKGSEKIIDGLGQTLLSIQSQTHRAARVIVLLSEDEEQRSNVKKMAKALQAEVQYQPVDFCLASITQSHIAILKSGDQLDASWSDAHLDAFAQNPHAELSIGWVEFVSDKPFETGFYASVIKAWNQNWAWASVKSLVEQSQVFSSSILFDRRKLIEKGWGDDYLSFHQDLHCIAKFITAKARFACVPRPLTKVTDIDSGTTSEVLEARFFELAYIYATSLVPFSLARAQANLVPSLFHSIFEFDAFARLPAYQRYRLVACLAGYMPADKNFGDFKAHILSPHRDEPEACIGQSIYANDLEHHSRAEVARFSNDIEQFSGGRDYWIGQAEAWKNEYDKISKGVAALGGSVEPLDARDGGSQPTAGPGIEPKSAVSFAKKTKAQLSSSEELAWKTEAAKWLNFAALSVKQNDVLVKELHRQVALLRGYQPMKANAGVDQSDGRFNHLYQDARQRGKSTPKAFLSASINFARGRG